MQRMEPASEEPRAGVNRLVAPRSGVLGDVVAGAGLGLLLGVVVGLATSPVVAIVVGALVSLLAVFLGLESRGESKLAIVAKVQINGLRIGTFGLAAVAGVLLGQWVRVNNPIAQPPQQQLARWQQAFPDNPVLAAQLMVHERTGITPAELKFDKDAAATPVAAASDAGALRPGLMATAVKANLCADLAPRRFGGRVASTLEAWVDEKGPYRVVAERIAQLPAAQQAGALEAAHLLVCELGRDTAAPSGRNTSPTASGAGR